MTKAKERKVLVQRATIPIMGTMGMNPSANGNVSHPSPQSNDSGNVGKSQKDAASSESAHYNNSRQSAGIPSSSEEADGSQNEGKKKRGSITAALRRSRWTVRRLPETAIQRLPEA